MPPENAAEKELYELIDELRWDIAYLRGVVECQPYSQDADRFFTAREVARAAEDELLDLKRLLEGGDLGEQEASGSLQSSFHNIWPTSWRTREGRREDDPPAGSDAGLEIVADHIMTAISHHRQEMVNSGRQELLAGLRKLKEGMCR